MDIVSLLVEDHRRVDELFNRFLQSETLDDKIELSRIIAQELAVHDWIEIQYLYPNVREIDEDMTDRSLKDHLIVEGLLDKITTTNTNIKASEADFMLSMTSLIENVRKHVNDEEQKVFLSLRKSLSPTQLLELGKQVMSAKPLAPKNPKVSDTHTLYVYIYICKYMQIYI